MVEQSDLPVKDPQQPQIYQVLSDLIMGFRITQMIYVATKLGIPDLLKDGPQNAQDLARATGTHAPSLYRVLRALAGLGIFAEDEQGRFALTPLADLLRSDVPGSMRSRALFYGDPSSWQTWGEFLYSVTTGNTASRHLHGMDSWEYRAQHPELAAYFNDFMSANTMRQAGAVVAAYDFSSINTLVDVGGGHGALMAAILRTNLHLHGILCDAPHVITGTGAVLEAAGVADRCEVVPCDFFRSVPAGGDAYLLKYIIHDWDDEHALAILKTCRASVPENGRLLLVENIIPPGNDPHPGKILDLQMLVELGGRERTEAEFKSLLGDAGFNLIKVIPTQSQLVIIEAVPR